MRFFLIHRYVFIAATNIYIYHEKLQSCEFRAQNTPSRHHLIPWAFHSTRLSQSLRSIILSIKFDTIYTLVTSNLISRFQFTVFLSSFVFHPPLIIRGGRKLARGRVRRNIRWTKIFTEISPFHPHFVSNQLEHCSVSSILVSVALLLDRSVSSALMVRIE